MLMKTDELGIPRFTSEDLVDLIYNGNINKCHAVLCDSSEDIDKFNVQAKEEGLPTLKKYEPVNITQTEFDTICQEDWFMPDYYQRLDIEKYLIEKCKTSQVVKDYSVNNFSDKIIKNILSYQNYSINKKV